MAEPRWLFPAVILTALLLRLQGIDWDEGRGLHPDEGNLVRAAAALSWERPIPQFHAYNDLALWLPKVVAAPFCDAGNEGCLRLAARALSALCSTLAVWAMAAIALRLAGRGAMLATAALAAASAPLIQWGHFGTTESVLILLAAMLWLHALRWLRGEVTTSRMAFGSALMLGLGFGFKSSALVMAVVPLLALALQGRPDALRLKALALALPLTLAVALASAPSVIFATQDWLATMRFENGVVQGSVPVFWTRQFEGGSGPVYQLRQLWGALEGAGLLLALVGLVMVPRQAIRGLIPGLGFALVYAGLTFGWHAAFFRYLAPVFPAVLVLAGIGAARLLCLPSHFMRALSGVGLALVVLTGLDLAVSYQARDPRLVAETELVARARPGEVVAVEPYDTPLTGGVPTRLLPLDGPVAVAIATPLAESDWLLVASRRNWGVLPGVPQAAPLACSYYAALVRGELGFRPVASFRRASPLGRLSEPGVAGEETRVVFDRPTLILLRNDLRLDAATIAARISAAPDPAACTPAALAEAWARPR